jgi:predicted amidohydrolase
MVKSDLKQTLHVGIVQSNIHWQEKSTNLKLFEDKIDELPDSVDLILLPEMFNTGFSMNAKSLAEPENGDCFRWMSQMAKKKQALVLGSVITVVKEKYFNRLYWIEPDGQSHTYDKRHLFRMGNEHLTYTQGSQKLVKQYKGWNICPLICYDLRFPVWSRNRIIRPSDKLEYDLLIFLANWPKARSIVWDVLLQARALENLCYVTGVNRTGSDGEGIDYNGHSNIYDFKGQKKWDDREEEFTDTVTLDLAELQRFRSGFPVHLDADEFELKI